MTDSHPSATRAGALPTLSEQEWTQRIAAGRPLWHRLASRLRTGFRRVWTMYEGVEGQPGEAPLPPAHLRIYYYGTRDPAAFARASRDAVTELTGRGLTPAHRVLDIGCGIGNLALGLRGFLKGGYEGLDVHSEAIAWCQQAITPVAPGFHFTRADLNNRAYNPGRATAAENYRFPFPDRAFDFILVGSVFTHMLAADFEHYVKEIARVLDDGGTCVASCYLLNDASRDGIARAASYFSFPFGDPTGRLRVQDISLPEAAVAMDEDYVRQVHRDAGLNVADVRRGRWFTGAAHDQDVLTVRRR